MSTDIIYDRQFIKLSGNRFIPMTLCGSSNTFDIGKYGRCGRRSRDWSNWKYYTKGESSATPETLMANLAADRERLIEQYKNDETPYTDEEFGWFTALAIGSQTCRKTGFSKIKALFVNGIKQALTVEELKQFNITTSVNTYCYDDKTREAINAADIGLVTHWPSTSEELESVLNSLKDTYKNYPQVGIEIRFTENEYAFKRLKQVLRPRTKKIKKLVVLPEYWVLSNINGYFIKNLKWGYKYAYSSLSAKKFMSEKAALKAIRDKGNKHNWKAELIEVSASVYK